MAYFLTKLLGRYSKRARTLTGGDPAAVRLYSDRVLATPVESLLDPNLQSHAASPDEIDLNRPFPRFESPVTAGRLTADRLGPPPAWGLPELRGAVAARLECRADDVLITRGGTGAFAAVLDAFVNPGVRVVLSDPGPAAFSIGAASRRAAVGWVPETCDAVAFRRAVSGAKLVAFTTPNNPTGRSLTNDNLSERIDLATRAGAVVYLDGTFDPNRPLPTGKRVLVGGSVSPWGMSGLRVGWLAGPPG